MRSEARERSLAYLQGLLSHCERKNGWQLAEWMGEAAPYRIQHLLNRGRWDADAAQDRLRDYVLEELSSPDTVLAILRARGEKTPDGQVPLSVPELRHLLTRLLWRGWRGIEHLLHWSRWRRQHQFHALCCHYRKRGSPLPVFYLQLY